MPGANARALEKARDLPADCLILDLEDSVPPDAKAAARQQVADAVSQGGYGYREVVVRVNGLGTSWGRDDVVAIATCGADAILFPKVESPEQVRAAVAAMDEAGAARELPLWIMVETPRGVLHIEEIAAASARLAVVVLGTQDLGKDLRICNTPDRRALITSLSMCVLGARAHGLVILDGVHRDLDDDEGLRVSCEQGRTLGFDGKTLINPRQLSVANEVFAPSAAEVADARRIIDGWGEAKRAGKGIALVDGKMVESLHVADARRILILAEAIEASRV
jgi:citrate lyase subunit beta/citryl-CoA lyase